MSKHNWHVSGVGNWYTEYACRGCHDTFIQHDDSTENPPVDGCKGIHSLPSSKSIQLKDHQIAQMINELTEAAREFGQAQCVREKLRTVVLKHLKPLKQK